MGMLLLVALAGCSGTPTRPDHAGRDSVAPRQEMAPRPPAQQLVAADMLGRPYRYGGASLRGFDFSGLVRYAFGRAGIMVPRTTAAQ